MDIWELFTRPEWLPYACAVLTGYFLASLFAEGTSFWRNRGSFDKLLVGGALGLSMFFAVGYPIVLLSSPWTGLVTIQQVNQSSGFLLLSCFLLIPLSFRAIGIPTKKIFRAFAYIIFLVPYVATLELFLAWLVTLEVPRYPLYVSEIIAPIWGSFLEMSLVCFFLSMMCFLIYQLLIVPLEREQYRRIRLVSPERKSNIKGLRHRLFLLKPSIRRKHKTVFLVLGGVIFVPSIIIPLDQHLQFITPRLDTGEEQHYVIPNWNRELVLARFLGIDSGDYRFYELMHREYNLTIPAFDSFRSFLHADSVYIANPSNSSRQFSSQELGLTLSNWNDVDALWVSCRENVSFTPQPSPENVEGIVVDFANVTGQVVSFNVSYRQLFLDRNITITMNQTIRELSNNTRLECYYFAIENKEDCTLKVPYFEFERLSYAEVDRDSAKVYIDGKEDPLVTVGRYFFYPWMRILSHKTGNLTLTLISHKQTQT